MSRYHREVDSMFPQTVEWRRALHRNPELSFHESRTSAFVAERLQAWGLEVRTGVGGHGVVGRLHGSEPGKTVALRADLDALPIQDEKHCDYASEVPGVMHACGHDAHTSALLTAAKILSEARNEWKGTVVFLFQPAEEVTPGGAKSMIEDGALDGVEAVYGVHLWTPFQAGTVFSPAGPMMASADEFVINIKGKGGHAGLPHETIDTILVGSQFVTNLQTIVSRRVNPIEPCVVSVGTFQAGNSFNVIAETCTLKGTVRTYNDGLRHVIKEQIEETLSGICSMYGAEYSIDYKMGYPPLINHAGEAERCRRVAGRLFGEANLLQAQPVMAAEDFAYYLKEVPGCFMFVGARNEDEATQYSHHHPKFDIDEQSMKGAAKLLFDMALDYLGEAAV